MSEEIVGQSSIAPEIDDDPITQWAIIRNHDLHTREMQHSLRVRDSKPLGSQGFTRAEGQSLRSLRFPDELFAELERGGFDVPEQGLVMRLWGNSRDQAWLYVWNGPALMRLLNEKIAVLIDAGFTDKTIDTPAELTRFVQWIRDDKIAPLTPMFDLIADCYGDKTNAGRTDVLPGVDRRAMFREYSLRNGGHEDMMSLLYFKIAGMM